MTIREAIDARHSVRQYTKRPIDGAVLKSLQEEIAACCEQSGLSIRLVRNDPNAVKGLWASYGAFENADNYIMLAGPDTDELFRLAGYWGEKLVLYAETLGLSTCWIAGSYKKRNVRKLLNEGEALAAIISIGYALKPGKPHKSKTFSDVTEIEGDAPESFRAGVEAALKAPTAINQQRFRFLWRDGKATVRALSGPYTLIDLGIVQYHYEIGAGEPIEVER